MAYVTHELAHTARDPAGLRAAAARSTRRTAEQRRHTRERAATRKVEAVRTRLTAERSPLARAADALTALAGSPPFLVGHILWFAAWIVWNGVLAQRPFDPYPFGFLTLVVSLEAIVLTIFVLMSQRREAQIAELREELTLEVDMRTEEEVTKTLQLVVGLYGRLGFPLSDDAGELRPLLEPLDHEEIARELSDQVQTSAPGRDQPGALAGVEGLLRSVRRPFEARRLDGAPEVHDPAEGAERDEPDHAGKGEV